MWFVWVKGAKGWRLAQKRRNKRGYRGRRPPGAAYRLRNRLVKAGREAIIRDHRPGESAPKHNAAVIKRSESGLKSRLFERTDWSQESDMVLHHTVGPWISTPAAERRYMREVEAMHKRQGWLAIGYHYVVFPSGRIYEGRPENTVGAHCPGKNHLPGVALAGTFTSKKPTLRQVAAVRALQRKLFKPNLGMHRWYYATACPGDQAVAVFSSK